MTILIFTLKHKPEGLYSVNNQKELVGIKLLANPLGEIRLPWAFQGTFEANPLQQSHQYKQTMIQELAQKAFDYQPQLKKQPYLSATREAQTSLTALNKALKAANQTLPRQQRKPLLKLREAQFLEVKS